MKFYFSVIEKFGITDINHDLLPSLVLRDNLGTRIPTKDFKSIVMTFHSGSNFYINASIENGIADSQVSIVTPYMLDSFLITHANDLLAYKNAENVTKQQRRAIINASISFMEEVFGVQNISKIREMMTARATVVLFPALKNKLAEDEGIVSTLNQIF